MYNTAKHLLYISSITLITTASACQYKQKLALQPPVKQTTRLVKTAPKTEIIKEAKILSTELLTIKHQEIQSNLVTEVVSIL